VEIPARKGQPNIFDTDETPRRDSTIEALAKLQPAFVAGGKVTAGNAPGLNDGAAAVVVASREKAESMNIHPWRIVGYAQSWLSPYLFDLRPFRLLEKVGWELKDVDLIEVNEATNGAGNGYSTARQRLDWEKVNARRCHCAFIRLGQGARY
jgi:acetyl-CoA C-acetyltransferase